MLAIQGTSLLGCIFLEDVLHGDAPARCGPHVSDVEVVSAVVVVVEPANAHARPRVLGTGLRRHIRESPVAMVAIEIFAAEVVYHIKIGPAVTVVVVPPTAKTVASVVLVEARFGGHIPKRPIPIVAQHEIRRTVFGVIIRSWILVLISALVIDIEAKIDVQPAVAIVICHCGAGEGSRWSAGKSKSVRLLAEPASTFIQKQQRAVGADDDEILASIIVDVNKEGAGGVFEHSHSSRVGDVLKGAVSPVAIEPIRKAGTLADVEVIGAVVIDVSDRDTVVPIDIDSRRTVENGPPIVRASQKLRTIRRHSAERVRSNIAKNGFRRAAPGFFESSPGA